MLMVETLKRGCKLVCIYTQNARRFSNTVLDDMKKVHNACKDFLAPMNDTNILKELVKSFELALELGMNPGTRHLSSLKCYNTHIQCTRFDRAEPGEYLSMHLGGTVLNFMRLTVGGPGKYTPCVVTETVPEIMKKSSGELLFTYMADKLRDFVWGHFSFRTEHVPLVFCFSFPLEQTSLDRGTIISWAKGYKCDKTIGQNVNTLLRQAALNKGLSLDIKAIINDVGSGFITGRTKTRLCSGGIIVGSGTNACYLEPIRNVAGFYGDFESPLVLINTEWGAFGDKGELEKVITEYDRVVDATSQHPEVHQFEKMTSGLFIGEIVRLFLVRLIEEKLLFDGIMPERLKKKDIIKASWIISFINNEELKWKKLFDEVLHVKHTQQDIDKIRRVCDAVAERASRLVAVGLAGLAHRSNQPVIAFTSEGMLVNGIPNFANIDAKAISLCDKRVRKIFMVPTYGSALKGAAILASTFTQV